MSSVSTIFKVYSWLIPATLFLCQVKEYFEGSAVYRYTNQRAVCSACTKWEEYVNTVVDVFFSKDKLKTSCARGLKKGKKLGHFPFVSPWLML